MQTIDAKIVTDDQIAFLLQRIDAALMNAEQADSMAMRCWWAGVATAYVSSALGLGFISDAHAEALTDRAIEATGRIPEPSAPALVRTGQGDFRRDWTPRKPNRSPWWKRVFGLES